MRFRWIFKMTCLSIVVLLVTGINISTYVSADSSYIEDDYSDFSAGTLTDTEIKNVGEACAFIHLEDNNSETHSVANVPTTSSDLPVDPGSGNNIWVETYAQSFVPTFTGVVDKVELQVYKNGNPADGNSNPATLTIKLMNADQDSPHHPTGNPIIQHSFLASTIPANAGTWTTFYLTETDSVDNTVLSADTHYSILVTSNAVADANNEFRWEYAVNNDADTDATEKGYNGVGAVCWRQCVSGGNHYDYQFKIYVHDFVHSGNFVSQVIDFTQTRTFTAVGIDDRTGGLVALYTRSGDTSEPDETWSDWIFQGTGSQNPGMTDARYAQYKLEFIAGANDDTTNAVKSVEIRYV